MEYESVGDKDYMIMEHDRLEIVRRFHNDPDHAGDEIIKLMISQLQTRQSGCTVFHVGDSSNLVVLGFEDDDSSHSSQLFEVRTDGEGMPFTEPMPKVKGNAVLPMVSLTIEEYGASTSYMLLRPGVEYGSIASLVRERVMTGLPNTGQPNHVLS